MSDKSKLTWRDAVIVAVTEALTALAKEDTRGVQLWLGNGIAAARQQERSQQPAEPGKEAPS